MKTDQRPAVDRQVLDKLRDIIGEAFDELIPAFIQQSDDMIKALLPSLNNGNMQALERLAHSLKSSSSNIGANQLAKLAMQLEEHVRQQHDEAAMGVSIELLCQEYPRVRAALLAYKNKCMLDN